MYGQLVVHFIMKHYDKCFGYTFCLYFARFSYQLHFQCLEGNIGVWWFSRQQSLNTNDVRDIMAIKKDINQHNGSKWDDIRIFPKLSLHSVLFNGIVLLLGGHLHFVTRLLWNLHNKVEFSFARLQWNVVPR